MIARITQILLLSVLLAACGFQLRGSYGIDETLQPMYVQAGGEFGNELRRALAAGGIELTRDRGEASSTLRVMNADRERRVLAIRQDGRVDEYELVLRVDWRLEGSGDGDSAGLLIEATRYSGQRSYIFDPGSRLAADDEEEVLIEILHSDLADRILRRIEAWSPGDAPETGSDESA